MSAKIKEPLYKRLNKERTQGNYYIENSPKGTGRGFNLEIVTDKAVICQISAHSYNMSKGHHLHTKENKATAEYTALAVNNLSVLAQALEAFVKDIEGHPSHTAAEHYKPLMDKAKEALNKIS